MARLNYSPPEDAKELALDLLRLQEYYYSHVLPPALEMILDLSLCKVIRAVSRLFGMVWRRGDTTLSPVKARKKKVVARKTDILEAFYLIENSKIRGKSLTLLTITINNKYFSKGIKPLSNKTIIRYLQSEERTRREFIELGVIKDKTDSVQEKM